MNKIQRDRIDKAIRGLIKREPFFAHIAMGLRVQETTKIPTCATDGTCLIYNPEYVAGVDDEELIGLMAHETLHAAYLHPWRGVGLNNHDFQIAADIQINEVLVKHKFKLPDGGGVQEHGLAYDGYKDQYRSVEQIYNIINGHADHYGVALAGLVIINDSEEAQELEREMHKRVLMGAMDARACGSMSPDLERIVELIGRSEQDWRDSFRRYLGAGHDRELTWSRPNRRFINDGLYLPGAANYGCGEIVLAIDTSGSISDSLLAKFMAEAVKVNHDVHPDKVHVLCCDTRIQWSKTFSAYEEVYAYPKGRGGTRFTPVFDWVREREIKPKALVYFTDLDSGSFGSNPGYPVQWIVWPGGKSYAPFGEIVRMDG